MKKVKLMIVSLSILAVVSGALAFKVKQGDTFCAAVATSSTSCPVNCPDLKSITDPAAAADFVCTTPSVNEGCTNVKCPTSPIHSTFE
jgi:hypothetical protein